MSDKRKKDQRRQKVLISGNGVLSATATAIVSSAIGEKQLNSLDVLAEFIKSQRRPDQAT